jgi:hypothetical protein
MELEFTPKSAEVVIRLLQESANQARFINGVPLLEYPEPRRVAAVHRRKHAPRKKKAGQQ